VLLHADASHVTLHDKGNENDKGRANMAPSSCQNNDEPGPGGTWACQEIHLLGYDVQTGKMNSDGCQT